MRQNIPSAQVRAEVDDPQSIRDDMLRLNWNFIRSKLDGVGTSRAIVMRVGVKF